LGVWARGFSVQTAGPPRGGEGGEAGVNIPPPFVYGYEIEPDTGEYEMGYVSAYPAAIRIDGAFGEWTLYPATQDPSGDPGSGSPGISFGEREGTDITLVQMAADNWTGSFHVSVVGQMMEGREVSFSRNGNVRSGGGETGEKAPLDSDRDGIPDDEDPHPFDYDNDGLRDDVDSDMDGDGLPNDVDFWLGNGSGAIYIGPVSVKLGDDRDILYAYMDADGDTSTGKRVSSGVGAEIRFVLEGKEGKVEDARVERYIGRRWSYVGSVEAAADGHDIEFSGSLDFPGSPWQPPVDDSTLENITVLVVAKGWDESEDTSVGFHPSMVPGTRGLGVVADGNATSGADRFGFNVSGAGDLNNDGLDDVVVGAPYVDYGSTTDCGAVYIFFGWSGISLGDLDAGLANVTIYGGSGDDHFGWDVAVVDDINGDSYADIVVGAPGVNGDNGSAYVIYGRSTTNWNTVDGTRITNSGWGTTIVSIAGSTPHAMFGYSVDSAGNVDNSGNTDFVVGAPGKYKVYLEDDFESGVGSWTHMNTGGVDRDNWELGTPTAGPSDAHSGSNCWGTNLGGAYTPSSGEQYSAMLISPSLTLGDGQYIYMRFWHYRDFESSSTPYDGGNLKMRTYTGGSWTGWWQIPNSTIDPDYDAALDTSYDNPLAGQPAYCYAQDWSMVTVNLTNNASQTVQIAWEIGADNYGTSDAGWYIDDVLVWGCDLYRGRGEAFVFLSDGSIPTSSSGADVKLEGATMGPHSADETVNAEHFGEDVAGVGDINNDGYDDIAVGSPHYKDERGRTSIYYGPMTRKTIFYHSFNDSVAGDDVIGWYEYPDDPGGYAYVDVISSGRTGSTAVECQGNNVAGYSYIRKAFDLSNISHPKLTFYWQSTGLGADEYAYVDILDTEYHMDVVTAGNLASWTQVEVDLSGYQLVEGFLIYIGVVASVAAKDHVDIDDVAITGIPAQTRIGHYSDGEFGLSSAGVGDVNGDGIDDMIVGEPMNSAGNAYLYEGDTTQWLPSVSREYFVGYAVDSTQVAAQSFTLPGDVRVWGVEVMLPDYGSASTQVTISINSSSGWEPGTSLASTTISPNDEAKFTIAKFSSPVSLSADTVYWIVAYNTDSDSNGYLWLFDEGSDSSYSDGWLMLNDGTGWANVSNDRDFCFKIRGEAETVITGESSGDRFGWSVSDTGDMGGDGNVDFAVGAPYSGTGGKVYIFNGTGGNWNWGNTVSASNANYTNQSAVSNELFGWSVAWAGEVRKAGENCTVVGAIGNATPSTSAGAVYLLCVIPPSVIPEFSTIAVPVAAMIIFFHVTRSGRREKRSKKDREGTEREDRGKR
ncbi:MAG: FG-GAP repeat protein, partial [Thermoplasmata archaeon]|nr:FG-GAP repeat protein [Thermoplasmata archaeon]